MLYVSVNFFNMRYSLIVAIISLATAVVCDGRSVIQTDGKYDYIVSVPDVHGDLEILIRSLWMAKSAIDKSENVSIDSFHKSVVDAMGKDDFLSTSSSQFTSRVLLVQTGDIVDRGPASLSCYKALWAAARDVLKWDLVNLFGNHEVMSMAGQADHYAHPDDIKEFGSLGARRNEFSVGGKLWKKLTSEFQFMLKVVVGNEKVLFVHAGIAPHYMKAVQKKFSDKADDLVVSLNEFLLNEVVKNPSSDYLTSAQSPIWTRDMAQGSDKQICKNMLPAVMRMMDVTRIVVGHTPQETLVTGNRCGGHLLLADVAMSRWMGSGHNGNPSVVVFNLSNNGNKLDKIVNMYWKGEVVGTNGRVAEDVLVQTSDESGENPEL